LNTHERLSNSLLFIDIGLGSANHTTETVSTKDLFSLVSDIALQCFCAARLDAVGHSTVSFATIPPVGVAVGR
jgi:hypothetical protein